MNTTRLVILTPEELKQLIAQAVAEAIAPFAQTLEIKSVTTGVVIIEPRKHAYTVAEVAEQIGYKPSTVLTFIKAGRTDKRGKVHKLPKLGITTKEYRITPADLDKWLSHF